MKGRNKFKKALGILLSLTLIAGLVTVPQSREVKAAETESIPNADMNSTDIVLWESDHIENWSQECDVQNGISDNRPVAERGKVGDYCAYVPKVCVGDVRLKSDPITLATGGIDR